MRIITLNANGIRAAARKGFYSWLARQIGGHGVPARKRKRRFISSKIRSIIRAVSTASTRTREKKGYSGVAIYTRREPDEIVRGYGSGEFDREGRYIEARFGELSVRLVVRAVGVLER